MWCLPVTQTLESPHRNLNHEGPYGFIKTTQQKGMVVMLNESLRVSTCRSVGPAAYKRKSAITGNSTFIYKSTTRGEFCIDFILQLPVIVYLPFKHNI